MNKFWDATCEVLGTLLGILWIIALLIIPIALSVWGIRLIIL